MGSCPCFGGKQLTAGRSSSERCRRRQMATGSLTLLARQAPLRHDSERILYSNLIPTMNSQNSQPLFHLTAKTLERIPRIPCSWNKESKISNGSQGHAMCIESTIRMCGWGVLFLLVSPYETLAGESEVVLGDTRHAGPHPAVVREALQYSETNGTGTLSVIEDSNPRV